MTLVKMSWRTKDVRLASEWVESAGVEACNPAWMQSSYPYEASARRSGPNQMSSMSPFGKPRYSCRDSATRDGCA
jgi:hypothetical protein